MARKAPPDHQKETPAGAQPEGARQKSTDTAGGGVNAFLTNDSIESRVKNQGSEPTLGAVLELDATTAALLAHQWRGGAYGYIWTLDHATDEKISHWGPVGEPLTVPQAEGLDVYFGVCPTQAKGERWERASEKGRPVAALNCLFGEFDAKDFCGACGGHVITEPDPDDPEGKKKRRACGDCGTVDPEHSKAAALALVEALEARPSVVIDSGGGYHVYWLLDQPFLLPTPDARELARSYLRAWINHVGSDPGAKDLERVLRVPGTRNYKPERGPDFPLVVFVWAELDRLYSLAELVALAPPEPETIRPVATVGTVTPSANGNNPRYVEAAIEDELAALRGTPDGGRNVQLNTSSLKIGEFVGAGAITRAEAERLLEEAATTNGLVRDDGINAVRATIRSGLDAGEKKPRAIPAPSAPTGRQNTGSASHRKTDAGTEGGGENGRPASWPYVAEDGRLYFCKANKDGEIERQPIADLQARIIAEAMGEDGDAWFTLEGTTAQGRSFTLEIRAGDFSDASKLKAALTGAAGARATILPRMAIHLQPAIQRLTLANIQTSKRFDRTGWDGDHFLIPGREPAGVTLHLPPKIPYGFTTEAELDLGLEALDALIQAMGPERTAPIFAFIFEGPMARLAGLQNERYGMMITGRTGTYKTSWAQAALAIYGADFLQDDRLIKWGEGSTRNSIMKLATQAHDLPLLVDNYKPSTGGGARDFVNLIHNILEGGEKLRLTRSSELRETRPIHTWPLITGEDVPDNDPASLARILIVPFGWNRGEPNPRLTQAQKLGAHLPAVGSAWLDWLEENGANIAKQIGATFHDERQRWAYHLNTIRKDMANSARVASNLASNALAWELALQHPTIGPVLASYATDYRLGLETIAAGMAEATAESLEALRFLNAIRSLLAGGRYVLAEKGSRPNDNDRDRLLGYQDITDRSVYILVDVTRAKIDRELGSGLLGGISNMALYRQLEALELIASHNPGRLTKNLRPSPQEKIVNTLHLTHQALEEEEPDLEEGTI